MYRWALGFLVALAAAGCPSDDTHTFDAGKDAPPLTQAALHLTPQMADFGAVNLGITTPPMTFTVSNTGESTTGAISAIAIGFSASLFHVETICTTLAASGTCVVTVTFTNSMLGGNAANLVVSASPGGTVMAALSAAGVSFGTLAISPGTFAFPDQAVNTTGANQVFTVTNNGGIATGVFTVTPAGSDPGQFVRSADTCAGAMLAPSASCTLTTAFHPTSSGAKTASFDVSGNPGGHVSASVTGTGI